MQPCNRNATEKQLLVAHLNLCSIRDTTTFATVQLKEYYFYMFFKG